MNVPTSEFDTGLALADLVSKQAKFVKTPWGEFALYESNSELFCASAFCPHMEGPLFEGSIIAGIATCPWHSWRFRLSDGMRIDEEDCEHRLTICKTRIGPAGTIIVLAPANG